MAVWLVHRRTGEGVYSNLCWRELAERTSSNNQYKYRTYFFQGLYEIGFWRVQSIMKKKFGNLFWTATSNPLCFIFVSRTLVPTCIVHLIFRNGWHLFFWKINCMAWSSKTRNSLSAYSRWMIRTHNPCNLRAAIILIINELWLARAMIDVTVTAYYWAVYIQQLCIPMVILPACNHFNNVI